MNLYESKDVGSGVFRASCSFVVGASGAVGTLVGAKSSITVTRSAAGQYTVQWDDQYKGSLVAVDVSAAVGVASGNPTITQSVAIGVPNRGQSAPARTVKFSTLTSGAVADLASGSEVFITLHFASPGV